jgi:hypothetical protein
MADAYCVDHPNDESAKGLYNLLKYTELSCVMEFELEEIMSNLTEKCEKCENKDVCNPTANPTIPKISLN